MTYCYSYVRELSVHNPCSVPLFWSEGVFDGGHCFVFGVKRAAPRPSTVYLLYSRPCMLGKERAKAQGAVAQWWGTLQPYTHTWIHAHTCTHRVSSMPLWNRKHSWLHKRPFHQSSYRMWQQLESLWLCFLFCSLLFSSSAHSLSFFLATVCLPLMLKPADTITLKKYYNRGGMLTHSNHRARQLKAYQKHRSVNYLRKESEADQHPSQPLIHHNNHPVSPPSPPSCVPFMSSLSQWHKQKSY